MLYYNGTSKLVETCLVQIYKMLTLTAREKIKNNWFYRNCCHNLQFSDTVIPAKLHAYLRIKFKFKSIDSVKKFEQIHMRTDKNLHVAH